MFDVPHAHVIAVDLVRVSKRIARGNAARVTALPAVRRFLNQLSKCTDRIVATGRLRPDWWSPRVEIIEIPGSARYATHAFETVDRALAVAATSLGTIGPRFEHERTGWTISVETKW